MQYNCTCHVMKNFVPNMIWIYSSMKLTQADGMSVYSVQIQFIKSTLQLTCNVLFFTLQLQSQRAKKRNRKNRNKGGIAQFSGEHILPDYSILVYSWVLFLVYYFATVDLTRFRAKACVSRFCDLPFHNNAKYQQNTQTGNYPSLQTAVQAVGIIQVKHQVRVGIVVAVLCYRSVVIYTEGQG